MVIRIIIIPMYIKLILNWLNHFTKPEVRIKAPMAPVSGHGLIFTR
jgi:hypothetical protein